MTALQNEWFEDVAVELQFVEQQIDGLRQHTRSELIERWINTYCKHPPKGISRRLLEMSAAYELQAKVYGGLKPALRSALAEALDRSKSLSSKPKPPSLKPGSQLLREWNGRTHHVEVVDQGYLWNGERYRSLSAIATRITGTRWSGPRFFGL